MTNRIIITLTLVAALLLGACSNSQPADLVSNNLSTAAVNFEIDRRIVFYNGITDTYMLEVIGRCALTSNDPAVLSVTCKTGPNEFKKHFLGLSDNVTYVVEQVDGAAVSDGRYRVVFRPTTIIPDVELD